MLWYSTMETNFCFLLTFLQLCRWQNLELHKALQFNRYSILNVSRVFACLHASSALLHIEVCHKCIKIRSPLARYSISSLMTTRLKNRNSCQGSFHRWFNGFWERSNPSGTTMVNLFHRSIQFDQIYERFRIRNSFPLSRFCYLARNRLMASKFITEPVVEVSCIFLGGRDEFSNTIDILNNLVALILSN